MKLKSILLPFMIFMASGLFFSCIDLTVEKEYAGDVYITSKIINGDTLYAIEAFVQSNSVMTKVTMKNPDGTGNYELSKLTTGYYEYVSNDSSYSEQKPQTGTYSFTITFEEETTASTYDNLSDETIKPILIKTATPNLNGGGIDVDWQKDTAADYYSIKIFKKDTLIFASGLLNSDYSLATIYTYSTGWATGRNPHNGDSLNVVVCGIMKESDTDQYLEIQAISNSVKVPVAWPE